MTRAPTVRKGDLDRAIRALDDAGLTLARIEVSPGGRIVIVPGPPKPAGAGPGLTSAEAQGQPAADPDGDPPQDLDAWRLRKHGHRAAQGT